MRIAGIIDPFLYQEYKLIPHPLFFATSQKLFFQNVCRFANKSHRNKKLFPWGTFGIFLTIKRLTSRATI